MSKTNQHSTVDFRHLIERDVQAYTGVFVTDGQRARCLTQKALDYGLRAMCVRHSFACDFKTMAYEAFE